MDTVFIIEDDKDTFDALNVLLVLEGLKCAGYTNYRDAVEHIIDGAPCLVLFDLRVPGSMRSEQFVAMVRAAHPDVPLVVISGDPLVLKIAERLGVSGVLQKPFELQEVLRWAKQSCSSGRFRKLDA